MCLLIPQMPSISTTECTDLSTNDKHNHVFIELRNCIAHIEKSLGECSNDSVMRYVWTKWIILRQNGFCKYRMNSVGTKWILYMLIITRDSEGIMFSPCVFVCVCVSMFVTMFVRTI